MAIGGCGAERFFQRLRFFVVVQGGFVFFDDFLFDVLGADDGYFFAEGHEKVVDPVGFGQCQVNGVSVPRSGKALKMPVTAMNWRRMPV